MNLMSGTSWDLLPESWGTSLQNSVSLLSFLPGWTVTVWKGLARQHMHFDRVLLLLPAGLSSRDSLPPAGLGSHALELCVSSPDNTSVCIYTYIHTYTYLRKPAHKTYRCFRCFWKSHLELYCLTCLLFDVYILDIYLHTYEKTKPPDLQVF